MYSRYAVGNKVYGGGRSAPNIGPVDKLGYKEREANNAAKFRRMALQKRLAMKRTGQ